MRISCSTAHTPTCGGEGGNGSGEVPRNIATFVESIATIISIMKSVPNTRVNKPSPWFTYTNLSTPSWVVSDVNAADLQKLAQALAEM